MASQEANKFSKVRVELLQRSITQRSADDLKSIAVDNPSLYQEWMTELESQRRQLQREAARTQSLIERLHSCRSPSAEDQAA